MASSNLSSILLLLCLTMTLLSITQMAQYPSSLTKSDDDNEYKICEFRCVCIPSEFVIACNQQSKLKKLPNKIYKSTRKMIIQYAQFSTPYLYKMNLTGLEKLTYLKIIYSNLIGVESRAFESMGQLTYLDLSHNSIKVLESYTFSGLRLSELHLMENPGVKISEDTFGDLFVHSLNLRSIELKKLNYKTFANIQLKKLYLYNNQIMTIDPQFETIFSKPHTLIDLTANPLSCTCEMKWFLPIIKSKFSDGEFANEMKTMTFKCSSPLKLSGRDISRLLVQDMSCPSPKIKSISVLFGIPVTQLTCVAIGNNFRAPGVAWNYIESENVRELRRTPLKGRSDNTEVLQTSLTVNVTTLPNKIKAFTCTTWLEDSQSENIVVNIKAPEFLLQPQKKVLQPITTESSSKSNSKNTNEAFITVEETHFIFKKQFTVLEMIGAVIGTFTATLILLMIVAQIIKWWKRNHKHNPNYKEVNILKPYWTLGHDSNNTYSHPISNADYDVPRIYESRAPSICQSPPLQRMEFIDYKTQNRIYTS